MLFFFKSQLRFSTATLYPPKKYQPPTLEGVSRDLIVFAVTVAVTFIAVAGQSQQQPECCTPVQSSTCCCHFPTTFFQCFPFIFRKCFHCFSYPKAAYFIGIAHNSTFVGLGAVLFLFFYASVKEIQTASHVGNIGNKKHK